MPETLLSGSNVILYGRVMLDLQIVQNVTNPNPPPPNIPTHPPGDGANDFLRNQLAGKTGGPSPVLARIYAFAYEGHLYDLPEPAIFLVHGPGQPAEDVKPGGRAARAPAGTDRTGVAAQSYTFSDDMQMWSYDKGDFSLRLDMESGPLEQILLEATLNMETTGTAFSGAHARISGAHARISGAHARIAGAHARIRGNQGGGWSD